jgi:hypothetical protein
VPLSGTSVLLYLRTHVRPNPSVAPTTVRVELGTGTEVIVQPGEPPHQDVTMRTDPTTFNTLLRDPASLDPALRAGAFDIEGDVAAWRLLLAAVDPDTTRTTTG